MCIKYTLPAVCRMDYVEMAFQCDMLFSCGRKPQQIMSNLWLQDIFSWTKGPEIFLFSVTGVYIT